MRGAVHRGCRRGARGVWRGASAIERRLGIARTLLLGAALVLAGSLLSLSMVGALAGIPALIAGALLVLRALY